MSFLLPSWQWFAWQAAPSRGKKGGAKETWHAFRTSNDATSRAAGLSVSTWDELSDFKKYVLFSLLRWFNFESYVSTRLKPQSTENWWLSWLLVDRMSMVRPYIWHGELKKYAKWIWANRHELDVKTSLSLIHCGENLGITKYFPMHQKSPQGIVVTFCFSSTPCSRYLGLTKGFVSCQAKKCPMMLFRLHIPSIWNAQKKYQRVITKQL